MADTTVTLYLNTGFDNENIPDSLSLLQNSKSHVCNGVFMRQANRTEVKVEITNDIAAEVDYLVISKPGSYSHAYIVNGYTMTAYKTCHLYITLDALTTTNVLAKGSSAIDGWLTRKIKTKAEIGDIEKAAKLTLSEPWSPSEEMEEDYVNDIVGASSSEQRSYIQSTVDLDEITYRAKDYIDPETKNYVTVPEIPVMSESTSINIEGVGSAAEIRGLSLFAGDSGEAREAISVVHSLGVEAIKASYNVPLAYATPIVGSGMFVGGLWSRLGSTSAGLAPIPGYNPENKKAALLHQRVILSATCSGNQAEYSLSQIGTSFDFKYWADPAPWGMPYCRPATIKGNDNLRFGAIAGAQWQNFALGYSHDSGWKVTERQFNRSAQQSSIGAAGSFIPFVGSSAYGGADPSYADSRMGKRAMEQQATLTSLNIAGNTVGAINNIVGLRNNSMTYDENFNLQSPRIDFATQPGMQNYIGNDFSVTRTRLSDNDIRRFDEFLHKYGEAVDEEFTNDDVYTRNSYNYIQCSRVYINTEHPRWIKDMAKAQLEGGVRVWHTKPNTAALKIGGN